MLTKMYVAGTNTLNSKRGATAIEYGLIAALIAVVVIGGFQVIGTQISTQLTTIGAAV
ncbi:MAG: Flp family type IVb pilin [Rhodospirillaceae bacterium]